MHRGSIVSLILLLALLSSSQRPPFQHLSFRSLLRYLHTLLLLPSTQPHPPLTPLLPTQTSARSLAFPPQSTASPPLPPPPPTSSPAPPVSPLTPSYRANTVRSETCLARRTRRRSVRGVYGRCFGSLRGEGVLLSVRWKRRCRWGRAFGQF